MRTYDDAEAVAELDRRYSTPQLSDQRRRVREIIAARTGEAGLTYSRVAWENSGTPVTPAQANELRKLLPE